ncbi:uncharacterized protein LOC131614128 [Vicia villosa]|uniref:uncharacterized protein LOC131614128 n=1 Tax=Vicia villosa TaxID=3911 RepID=UPI00273ABBFF|nr:uncharacterized protein LOC131614128 [Vicia villosa]
MDVLLLLLSLLVAFLSLNVVESRKKPAEEHYVEYCAMSCRAYSALVTEFRARHMGPPPPGQMLRGPPPPRPGMQQPPRPGMPPPPGSGVPAYGPPRPGMPPPPNAPNQQQQN